MNPNNSNQFTYQRPSSAYPQGAVAEPFVPDYGTTGQPQDRIMASMFATGGRAIPLPYAVSTAGSSTNKPNVAQGPRSSV